MKNLIGLSAALVMAAIVPARAATIGSLYNTGVDSSHHALTGASADDPNYKITASDGATAPGGQALAYNCCYSADDGSSRWITVDSGGGSDAVNTTYETTFDLTGFNLPTVEVAGDFYADNHAEIFLNGADTGFHTDTFGAATPFTLTHGFIAGVNTLDFAVVNDGGPQALKVTNLSGSDTPVVGVPEPAAWALMLVGVSAMGGALRRRSRLAVPA